MERRRPQTGRELGPYRRHELLTGEIIYPMSGYTGYGDHRSTNLKDFISGEMRADWEANRDELIAFWKSGEHTTSAVFPDSKPWHFVSGNARSLPWAARVLDK